MQLEENQIVWTCCPTIECGYDERLEPRQVKLRLYRTIWYGHSFNHETGEIDKDPNATIVAKETNCFLTKKEANDCYAHSLALEICYMQDELKRFEETRNDL